MWLHFDFFKKEQVLRHNKIFAKKISVVLILLHISTKF